jgi:hypothetical protein
MTTDKCDTKPEEEPLEERLAQAYRPKTVEELFGGVAPSASVPGKVERSSAEAPPKPGLSARLRDLFRKHTP